MNDVKAVIHKFRNKNLKSFQVNLILGSPLEERGSINETISFIKEISYLYPGLIDFIFNYFYLDNNTEISNKYNKINIDHSKGFRKKYCFYPSHNMTVEELKQTKSGIIKATLKYMKLSLNKMPIKDRYLHLNLQQYGLYSQISMTYLSKGSTGKNYSTKKT